MREEAESEEVPERKEAAVTNGEICRARRNVWSACVKAPAARQRSPAVRMWGGGVARVTAKEYAGECAGVVCVVARAVRRWWRRVAGNGGTVGQWRPADAHGQRCALRAARKRK